MQQQVLDELADLHLIQRLEECRTQRGDVLDANRQSEIYARVLHETLAFDVQSPTPPDAAALILRRPGHGGPGGSGARRSGDCLRAVAFATKRAIRLPGNGLLEVAGLADPDRGGANSAD